MHGHRFAGSGALLAAAVAGVLAWSASASETRGDETRTAGDNAFTALQARGEVAMGVDQYTSTHVFDALPDGGRIELQRDVDDSAGVDRIRGHLQLIAEAFASGNFSTPAFVHLSEVPGTAVMAASKDRIEYVYRDLPRGGELRLVTSDPEAVGAIHEFMTYQREQHQAGGAGAGGTRHGAMHDRAMHHGGVTHDSISHRTHRMIPRGDSARGRHGGHPRGGDTP